MKLHITDEQWNELNDDQKDKFLLGLGIVIKTQTLGHSTDPRQGTTVNGLLPSIGQMIEFLGSSWLDGYILNFRGIVLYPDCLLPDNLCDTLWKKVKKSLKKPKKDYPKDSLITVIKDGKINVGGKSRKDYKNFKASGGTLNIRKMKSLYEEVVKEIEK